VTLAALAKHINDLGRKYVDTRKEFCLALADARARVARETNMTFIQWANINLRKPDGSKWSQWTLYSYSSYGRKPNRLDHSRGSIAKLGREARAAANAHKLRANSIADEVNFLMTAWEKASPEARKQFLGLIKE
jgi:hypothetical protein